jgi:hypothetical protein
MHCVPSPFWYALRAGESGHLRQRLSRSLPSGDARLRRQGACARRFFDDTEIKHGPRTVGAAGVLFDNESLARFNAGWAPHAAGLPGQYRTAPLHWGFPPFDIWSEPKRHELLRNLAQLIAKTRDAGFAATVDLAHYDALKADQPRVAAAAGGPYTVALMSCLESVGRTRAGELSSEEVYYWFEAGNGQAEANDFVQRAYKNPKTRERFSYRRLVIHY